MTSTGRPGEINSVRGIRLSDGGISLNKADEILRYIDLPRNFPSTKNRNAYQGHAISLLGHSGQALCKVDMLILVLLVTIIRETDLVATRPGFWLGSAIS